MSSDEVRALTHEADPQWDWNAVAWTDGGRSLIANRGFVDGTAGEVWKIDVASGKSTRLLGKPGVIYAASDATRDGSAVALTTNDGTHQLHAVVYAPASGAIRALKATPWEQSSGAISPDGRSMVVQTGEDGRQTLELVDLASLAERPLAMPPGVNGTIATQPFTPDFAPSDGAAFRRRYAGRDPGLRHWLGPNDSAHPPRNGEPRARAPPQVADRHLPELRRDAGQRGRDYAVQPEARWEQPGSGRSARRPDGTDERRVQPDRDRARQPGLCRHPAQSARLDRLRPCLPEGQFPGPWRRRPQG